MHTFGDVLDAQSQFARWRHIFWYGKCNKVAG